MIFGIMLHAFLDFAFLYSTLKLWLRKVMHEAQNVFINMGVVVGVLLVGSYVVYMVGLILVLRRLSRLTWLAFVPLANYYAQVRAINAPRRWFAWSLIPYVGAVYVGSVAIRLGMIFGRGPAFSLVWLTFGAPVGMMILGLSRGPVNVEYLEQTPKLLDVKAIKQQSKSLQRTNQPGDRPVKL